MATRDPTATQARILAAALHEFSANGLSGTRVQAIADRAQVNVRMLYHYFGNKEGLFDAVLRSTFEQRAATLDETLHGLASLMVHYYQVLSSDPDYVRLLQWEALSPDNEPTAARRRAARYAESVRRIKDFQDTGQLPAGLDPKMLLTAMIALGSFPYAFPQVTKMVTGQSPHTPRFRARYEAFLREFAKLTEVPPLPTDRSSG